jgi:Peptidase family M50.
MALQFIYRLGLLLSLSIAVIVISNLGTVAACCVARVRMTKIAFFLGKPVFTFATPLCPVCIGYNPLGGYVEMDMTAFPKHTRFVRCLVAIAGPLTIFMLASVILNFGRTSSLFLTGFSQLAHGALSPTAYAKPLISRFFQIASQAPLVGFGILAAKSATASMIPFPVLPGGRFLVELLNIHHENKRLQGIQTLCFLITVPVMFAWGYAIIRCLFAA